jgi:hypothetical protein
MIVIKPNTKGVDYSQLSMSVFLAGSIEMGLAENWQSKIEAHFKDYDDVVFFNPRRDDWDSSWEQDENNPEFNHQVNWELDHLEKCDIVFMYFDPNTKSPITLMELGTYGKAKKTIVCCPPGFYRRGNVKIFCSRNNIAFFNNIEEAIGSLMTKLHYYKI